MDQSKKGSLARQVRSTLLCFLTWFCLLVFTQNGWAQEPAIVEIERESQFLKVLESQFDAIIVHPHWKSKNAPDGSLYWVLLVPDFYHQFQIKSNVQDQYELYVLEPKGQVSSFNLQQSNTTQWVYRFGGKAIGEVLYPQGKKARFHPYVSSERFVQDFAKKYPGILFQNEEGNLIDGKGKIQKAGRAYQDRISRELRLIQEVPFLETVNQCIGVFEGEDVRNRQLLQKSFGPYYEKAKDIKTNFSENEKEYYLDEFEKKYKNPNEVDAKIVKEVLKTSLDTSLYSFMIFRELFFGSKTTGDLKHHFQQSAVFGQSTVQDEAYRQAVVQMVMAYDGERKKKPIAPLEGKFLDEKITQLNRKIKAIEEICVVAHREKVELRPDDLFDGSAFVSFTPQHYRENIRIHDLEKKVVTQVLPILRGIRESELGVLLFSREFRSRLGEFTTTGCVYSKRGLTKDPIQKVDVMSALHDVRKIFIAQIKQAVADRHSTNYKAILEKYMKSYPLTVQNVVTKHLNPEHAKLVCGVTSAVYSQDYWMRAVDWTLAGVGITAGVLCAATGIGIPASVAILSPIAAAEVIVGGVKWYEGYTLDQQLHQSAVSQQISREDALVEIRVAEGQISEGKWQTILSALAGASMGVTYTLHKNKQMADIMQKFYKTHPKQFEAIAIRQTKEKYSEFQISQVRKAIEKFQKAGDEYNLNLDLGNSRIDDGDIQSIVKILKTHQTPAMIRIETDMVLRQAVVDQGRIEKTFAILEKVSKADFPFESRGGVFRNSPAREKAIETAQKELKALGYSQREVDDVLFVYFDPNKGLLSQPQTVNVSREVAQSSTGKTSTTTGNRSISHTVKPDGTVEVHVSESPPPKVVSETAKPKTKLHIESTVERPHPSEVGVARMEPVNSLRTESPHLVVRSDGVPVYQTRYGSFDLTNANQQHAYDSVYEMFIKSKSANVRARTYEILFDGSTDTIPKLNRLGYTKEQARSMLERLMRGNIQGKGDFSQALFYDEAFSYFSNLRGAEKNAFQSIKGLLDQSSDPFLARVILYRAHLTGKSIQVSNTKKVTNQGKEIVRIRWQPDQEKLRALGTAKNELKKLGLTEKQADRVIRVLSEEKVMVLGKNKVGLEQWFKDVFGIGWDKVSADYFDMDATYYLHRFKSNLEKYPQKEKLLSKLNATERVSKPKISEIVQNSGNIPEEIVFEYFDGIINHGLDFVPSFQRQDLRKIHVFFNQNATANPFDDFVYRLNQQKSFEYRSSAFDYQFSPGATPNQVFVKRNSTPLSDLIHQDPTEHLLKGLESILPTPRRSVVGSDWFYFDIDDVRIMRVDESGDKVFMVRAKKMQGNIPSSNDPVIYFEVSDVHQQIRLLDDAPIRSNNEVASRALQTLDEMGQKNMDIIDGVKGAGSENDLIRMYKEMVHGTVFTPQEMEPLKMFIQGYATHNVQPRRLFSKLDISIEDISKLKDQLSKGEDVRWNDLSIIGAGDEFGFIPFGKIDIVFDTKNYVRINQNEAGAVPFLIHNPKGFQVYKIENMDGVEILYLKD